MRLRGTGGTTPSGAPVENGRGLVQSGDPRIDVDVGGEQVLCDVEVIRSARKLERLVENILPCAFHLVAPGVVGGLATCIGVGLDAGIWLQASSVVDERFDTIEVAHACGEPQVETGASLDEELDDIGIPEVEGESHRTSVSVRAVDRGSSIEERSDNVDGVVADSGRHWMTVVDLGVCARRNQGLHHRGFVRAGRDGPEKGVFRDLEQRGRVVVVVLGIGVDRLVAVDVVRVGRVRVRSERGLEAGKVVPLDGVDDVTETQDRGAGSCRT